MMHGGKIMDTFMDKIAQKINAQEIIKANHAAETAEMAKIQEEYANAIQEMRKLNLRNVELTEQVQQLIAGSFERIEQYAEKIKETNSISEQLEGLTEKLEKSNIEQMQVMFKESDEYAHKENVKVYRNVEAVIQNQSKVTAEQVANAMKEDMKSLDKKISGIKVIVIVAFILSLAGVGIQIAQIWNLL